MVRAEDLSDKKKAKEVFGFINPEENGRIWFFSNRVTDDPQTGSCLKVERDINQELESKEAQDNMVKCA